VDPGRCSVSTPEVIRDDQTLLGVYFVLSYFCVPDKCLLCHVRSSFFSTSQETGWEEPLRNNLFTVKLEMWANAQHVTALLNIGDALCSTPQFG